MFLEITLPFSNAVLFSCTDGGFYYKFRVLGFKFNIEKHVKDSDFKEALTLWYEENTGEVLRLENPQTLNEKIQWLKIYNPSKLKTQLADREAVRGFIAEKLGEEYLIPILGIWENENNIDFDILPEQFVIKCNHGTNYTIPVKNKSNADLYAIKKRLKRWMKESSSERYAIEPHYRGIDRKITIEEYLIDSNGEQTNFKVACMNGNPQFICVDKKSDGKITRDIYDFKWEIQSFTIHYPMSNTITAPPANIDKMLNAAKILSENFHFSLVEFHNIDHHLYVNNIIFTPNGGIEKIMPREYNLKLGQMLTLPIENESESEKICA